MSQPPNTPYGTSDAPTQPYGQPEPTSPYLSSPAQSYGTPDAQYHGLNPTESYNPWAIASLVLGLCATAILAVIAGHVALSQIKRTGQRGAGLAIAGLILGYLEIAFYTVLIIASLGFLAWAGSQS
ncbi:DUF4190 domain-containing protein [Pseudactinotalea suaedae]|uniref:DUF4190 domain-containing protein n=1 Tax=Pseudactinotalea suaedae TaxID=1524924 RepID=UPI001F4F389C|nr:DUF4190 domain-containing protein [Pseudactinotalea suaedae]